jgi:putative ABC transport system ATP-binding protein
VTGTRNSTGPHGRPDADPTPADLLQVSDVHKCYRDGVVEQRILDGVSFEVERGACVALLGRSGSGKSTLLNLIAGIDRPDRGRISFLGQPLSTLGEPALTLLRRRHVGFIYQFFNLLPTLTVAENLALPLELNGYPFADAAPRVERLLARLGLDGRRGAFPDQLSGGEQQRVAIGRALIHEPALVLADEPTGNLDAETGAQILELLAELFRDRHQSLILVTHSLAVSRIADRVLTLENGRLAGSGARLSW